MTKTPDVRVRRVYEEPESADGERVLVDRLWPRGMSKERAQWSVWLKAVAPSSELRRWYGHDPAKFAEFERRYRAELEEADHATAFTELRARTERGTVTLLTASKQTEISHAEVLRRLLA